MTSSHGILLQDPVDENGAPPGPLAKYAARYWATHARVKNVASRIRDGIERFFDPDKPYFSAWVKLHDIDSGRFAHPKLKIQPGAAPLYYAAFCGLHEIVEHLTLKYPQYTNAMGGNYGTALHAASCQGQIKVVRSLLECGVDVDARSVMNASPLQLALNEGRLTVMQYFLDHGADAHFQDDWHRTPLDIAAAGGHPEVVQVLLGHKAYLNSQEKVDSTPINQAHFYGSDAMDYPSVVRLLLEHGADPNALGYKRRTALHIVLLGKDEEFSPERAVPPWWLEVARTFLVHGADVDAKDEEGRTPMEVALAKGKTELVQLLSEYCSK